MSQSLFSVDKMMRLTIAIILDVFGAICLPLYFLGVVGVFIGETLSFISDILGFIFLGARKPGKGAVAQANKKKFILSFILEFLPISGAFFWWTIYVLSEKDSEETPEKSSQESPPKSPEAEP